MDLLFAFVCEMLMSELRKYSAIANTIKHARGREVFIMKYLCRMKAQLYRYSNIELRLWPCLCLCRWYLDEQGVRWCIRIVWMANLLVHWEITDKSLFTVINSFYHQANLIDVYELPNIRCWHPLWRCFILRTCVLRFMFEEEENDEYMAVFFFVRFMCFFFCTLFYLKHLLRAQHFIFGVHWP